ncbi:hypothetical protein K443DRAFT_486409 [Laccaria amethystina LaAM-08-1]|uniref:Uncharacterized protein n=1 Tax=Laccaria amethystina LaAM-08-1 TaxID=1095629 RepID=A0A0C9WHL4_9AGAR|nr:hypothetical protein K443DRAFT_486409 [Laccaria amethystina LaAM-08-1]
MMVSTLLLGFVTLASSICGSIAATTLPAYSLRPRARKASQIRPHRLWECQSNCRPDKCSPVVVCGCRRCWHRLCCSDCGFDLTDFSCNDFCLFAPPTLQNVSHSETYEVAWCTKQRNNDRVIPDGTIAGVPFLNTAFYVQFIGYGDLTKLNIPYWDYGGELDPRGAYGDGNLIGGNVDIQYSQKRHGVCRMDGNTA